MFGINSKRFTGMYLLLDKILENQLLTIKNQKQIMVAFADFQALLTSITTDLATFKAFPVQALIAAAEATILSSLQAIAAEVKALIPVAPAA